MEKATNYENRKLTIKQWSVQDRPREKYAKNGEKLVLYVTPYFSGDENNAKGGKNLVELAKKFSAENVRILVAGDYDKSMTIGNNITLLGRISDQKQLAKLYSIADVTVITSRRETFSMICAESLCCGTPVCGFFAGGPETIALSEHSKFVEYGDIDALYKAVKDSFNEKTEDISNNAVRRYKRENMCRNMLDIYESLLGKNIDE